jgi:hypothetical protein
MKGIFKKTEDGIIFTIDERPKMGDFYYDKNTIIGIRSVDNDMLYKDDHKVLASTFGIGLELLIQNKSMNKIEVFDFNKKYEYTINDKQLIVKL